MRPVISSETISHMFLVALEGGWWWWWCWSQNVLSPFLIKPRLFFRARIVFSPGAGLWDLWVLFSAACHKALSSPWVGLRGKRETRLFIRKIHLRVSRRLHSHVQLVRFFFFLFLLSLSNVLKTWDITLIDNAGGWSRKDVGLHRSKTC